MFGYDNIEIAGAPDAQGRPTRSHVELRINDTEAEIVRRIFRMYAKGIGFRDAKTLNAEGAICPRPRPSIGKPSGWVGSSIRQIILRPLYMGEQIWGRTKKRLPSRSEEIATTSRGRLDYRPTPRPSAHRDP